MPTIPKGYSLSQNSADILNAIRNSASQNFRDYTPAITDAKSIRDFGAVIMQMPGLQNEFLTNLWNRIAFALVTSKIYRNHFAWAKKGLVNYGETVEEIFVNLAKVEDYAGEDFENEAAALLAQRTPDVRAAFHPLNYKKVYATTTKHQDLRQAFLSEDGVLDLIGKIIEAIYKSAAYDEEQCFKYLLARHLLDGHLYPAEIDVAADDASAKSAAVQIKAVSNMLEFLSGDYNMAGVMTNTPKDDQYLIMSANFEATQGVRVLAYAFNQDNARYQGHVEIVDSFGALNNERLAEIFANDPGYTPLTTAEIEALNTIQCVMVDKDWFMCFDNLLEASEQWNGRKLYMNHFYHTWRTFSVSPFANAVAFIPGAPAVTGVTVTPAALTAGNEDIDMTVNLSAAVATQNFAPKGVAWSIEENAYGVTVDQAGNVFIPAGVHMGAVTVTATSIYDATKTADCEITLQ